MVCSCAYLSSDLSLLAVQATMNDTLQEFVSETEAQFQGRLRPPVNSPIAVFTASLSCTNWATFSKTFLPVKVFNADTAERKRSLPAF
jgi:hypothetical protein